MILRPKALASRQDRLLAAVQLANEGNLAAAKLGFTELLATGRHDAGLLFNLGLVSEQLGEIDAAVLAYARALRADPSMHEAGKRVSFILERYLVLDPSLIEPAGLSAALSAPGAALQPLCETLLRQTFEGKGPLAKFVADQTAGALQLTARTLIEPRIHPALAQDRLLTALRIGFVRSVPIERLLTAMRRALLLEVQPARFEDRDLFGFALALMQAARNGDFAWCETQEETRALDALVIDRDRLVGGDLDNSRKLLLMALYRPIDAVLSSEADAKSFAAIRPKSLRQIVLAWLDERALDRVTAASLPRLRPLTDDVSRRVASQYEKSPYPRWASAQRGQPSMLKPTLGRFFRQEALTHLDQPFDVLIAGAGTGQQVVRSASVYGPNARILAIDLSANSLAYAKRKTGALGLENVEYMLADILDLDKLDRQFRVIECIGVLHHMADPWAGWRKLCDTLLPGGIAYIGLYSAVSRANIVRLRSDADYPGPGCSDAAARNWRDTLMQRPQGAPGSELQVSHNFYNLNEFRDLTLHESEQQMRLPEIQRFLGVNRLRFAGFTVEPHVMDAFRKFTSCADGPGTFEQWQSFENAHPSTFDAMYRFWIERQE